MLFPREPEFYYLRVEITRFPEPPFAPTKKEKKKKELHPYVAFFVVARNLSCYHRHRRRLSRFCLSSASSSPGHVNIAWQTSLPSSRIWELTSQFRLRESWKKREASGKIWNDCRFSRVIRCGKCRVNESYGLAVWNLKNMLDLTRGDKLNSRAMSANHFSDIRLD